MKKTIIIISSILSFFLVVAVIIGFVEHKYMTDDYIFKNVKINNSYIGGMNKKETKEYLVKDAETKLSKIINISVFNKEYNCDYTDIGWRIDWDKIISEAYQFGREGHFWERWQARYNGADIPLYYKRDDKKLESYIENIAAEINQEPVNAKISINEDGVLNISQSKVGFGMDTDNAKIKLEELKPGKNEALKFNVDEIKPNPSTADAKSWGLDQVLTTFRTEFNPKQVNRTTNVRLAAKALNSQLIYPEERFSFNNTVGRRTKEKGYLEATTIKDGAYTEMIGGGICQVASTLYNAVLDANFKVTQRQPHSLPVKYVEPDKDAAIAYGSIDLRFINNRSTPVLLHTKSGENWVETTFYGK